MSTPLEQRLAWANAHAYSWSSRRDASIATAMRLPIQIRRLRSLNLPIREVAGETWETENAVEAAARIRGRWATPFM